MTRRTVQDRLLQTLAGTVDYLLQTTAGTDHKTYEEVRATRRAISELRKELNAQTDAETIQRAIDDAMSRWLAEASKPGGVLAR